MKIRKEKRKNKTKKREEKVKSMMYANFGEFISQKRVEKQRPAMAMWRDGGRGGEGERDRQKDRQGFGGSVTGVLPPHGCGKPSGRSHESEDAARMESDKDEV